jgi:hypothetical protein
MAIDKVIRLVRKYAQENDLSEDKLLSLWQAHPNNTLLTVVKKYYR